MFTRLCLVPFEAAVLGDHLSIELRVDLALSPLQGDDPKDGGAHLADGRGGGKGLPGHGCLQRFKA